MTYVDDYITGLENTLKAVSRSEVQAVVDFLFDALFEDRQVFIIGNGGSASIASHVSVDFAKVARVRSSTFNNANLITCFANDYGYENWVVEAIKAYLNKNDMMILISSSGTSKNIVNAAKYCKKNSIQLITLSGFKKNNPLSKYGNVNFHINSDQYNFIEMSHHIILVYLVDIFAKNKIIS